MNRIAIWKDINHYFLEGVITPMIGEYIVDNKDKTFKADLIGSLILSHVGPARFGVAEMPAIEPGVVAGLIKVYNAREIALLECAYEKKIFGWSMDYLSEKDKDILNDWIVASTVPPITMVRKRYRYFLNNLIRFEGDVEKTLLIR